jgi:8-oxo-dGTP pyrophosphatase MutT (NUDIX family)
MAISPYIKSIREKIGNDLLFIPAVSAIVINERNEVLLHRSADDGNWYTIGGAIDPGEEPADACVREALEETGLHVVPERILAVQTSPVISYPNGDKTMYVGIAFRCRPVGGDLKVADDESLEVRYFARDQLPPIPPHQRLRVELAFDQPADQPAYFARPTYLRFSPT